MTKKKKLDLFFKACEIVLGQQGYSSAKIASFECTRIAGVIYGAAERCDLSEYIEVLPAKAFGYPHTVLRCGDKIIDFTFSQFDESRKWPIKTKKKIKGLELKESVEYNYAQNAIRFAEETFVYREIMDKIVKTYENLCSEEKDD